MTPTRQVDGLEAATPIVGTLGPCFLLEVLVSAGTGRFVRIDCLANDGAPVFCLARDGDEGPGVAEHAVDQHADAHVVILVRFEI